MHDGKRNDINKSIYLDNICFVDADFGGLWMHEAKLDHSSVKISTKFVICLANFPIKCRSKLQTNIVMSKIGAEYNGLSVAIKRSYHC